jgi:uncharacterized protein YdaU (DUF1376 family)
MNNAPAFQHYANDFLAEIAFLSMEGRGVFITLKSYYWVKNGLPNDMRLLARLCALSEDAFTDNLYLDDLEQQRIYQEEKRGKAKASADARWKNANAMRTQCTSTSTPTSKHAEKEKPFQAQTAVEKDIPVIRMIWQFGVDLLKQSGVKEKSARSLLGKLAKEYTNDLLAECIAVTMSKNPVNVEEFLIGTLKQRKNGSNQKPNGYLSTAEKRLRDEIESEQLIRDLLDEAERESVPSEHHRVIEAHSSVS